MLISNRKKFYCIKWDHSETIADKRQIQLMDFKTLDEPSARNICFEHGVKTISFGHRVNETEANYILEILASYGADYKKSSSTLTAQEQTFSLNVDSFKGEKDNFAMNPINKEYSSYVKDIDRNAYFNNQRIVRPGFNLNDSEQRHNNLRITSPRVFLKILHYFSLTQIMH